MTIEQKAKAYDEALKDIKVIYPDLKGDVKFVVEQAFPELKESEDERIKKTAIKILKGVANRVFEYESVSKESVLADLEKQKETGIQWLKSDNVKNPDKPYIDKAGMFYTTDGRMCHVSEIERQKEPENVSATTMIPSCWTEKQKEQNPSEWSEEDEKMCSAILQDLANIKVAFPKVSIQEEFDWLKSLRPHPHWKPSEEQMESLKRAAEYDFYAGNGATLRILYNDLKKLM